jgi:hypothetical protein
MGMILLANKSWSMAREDKTRRHWTKVQSDAKYESQYGQSKKSPDDFENFVNSYKVKKSRDNSQENDNDYYEDDEILGNDVRSDRFLLNQYPEIFRINLAKSNQKVAWPSTTTAPTTKVPVYVTKKVRKNYMTRNFFF